MRCATTRDDYIERWWDVMHVPIAIVSEIYFPSYFDPKPTDYINS
jgi:hypothetical protein